MSDVQYENQGWMQQSKQPEKKTDFTDRLVKWGVASDRKQASYILLGVALMALLIAIFFMWGILFG